MFYSTGPLGAGYNIRVNPHFSRKKVELAAQARKLEFEFRGAAKLAPDACEAKLQELAQQLQALVDSVENGAGLRLDGTISHLSSGEQVWYDTTAVHTTCSTKIKAELVLTRTRIAAGKKEGKKWCQPD